MKYSRGNKSTTYKVRCPQTDAQCLELIEPMVAKPPPQSSCHSEGLMKLKPPSPCQQPHWTRKHWLAAGEDSHSACFQSVGSNLKPRTHVIITRTGCSHAPISVEMSSCWKTVKTTITCNSPPNHSRVLLHGSLQEALQDGPFSHGWS